MTTSSAPSFDTDEPVRDHATPVDAAPGMSPSILLSLGGLVALTRWLFSRGSYIFFLTPDEPATFGMARWLSGGTPMKMFDLNTWRPGLATILAPIFWVTDRPETVMRAALATNAVIAGASAAVLAVLVQRVTHWGTPLCVLVALATSLTPSSLSASSYVWAEPLVSLTFGATLLLLVIHFETGRPAFAVASILCAVVGFNAHSRMLPTVIVVTTVVVLRSARRRRWSTVLLAFLTSVTATYASYRYADFVWGHLWDTPSEVNTSKTVLANWKDPISILESAAGQIWYQLAATALAVGFGAAFVLKNALGGPVATEARLVLVTVAPMMATSIVFLAGQDRSDIYVYGRYNDAVLRIVVAVGLGVLIEIARTKSTSGIFRVVAVTGAMLMVLGFVVELLHGERLRLEPSLRPMIAGLQPLVGTTGGVNVVRITLVSLAIGLALTAIARLGSQPLLVLSLVLVLVLAGFRTHEALASDRNLWDEVRVVREVEGRILPPGVPVGFRFVPDDSGPSATFETQATFAVVYQYFLPDHEFYRDGGNSDDVGPFVFAPANEPEMIATGAKVLWSDPFVSLVLWDEGPRVPSADK